MYHNNPYNFIGLPEQVFKRYNSAGELPSHTAYAPGLISGTIHCVITAETPLCVDSGKGTFFRNAAGKYAIPGSTLKGLVRTNMQILGRGAIRPDEDFADLRMMYRSFADARNSVRAGLKAAYTNQLKDDQGNPKVKAGYLVQRSSDRKYVIYPLGCYYSVLREASYAAPWRYKFSETSDVWYKNSGNKITQMQRYRKGQNAPGGMQHGILLASGRMYGAKHLYLFPDFQTADQENPIELSDNAVLSYKTDFEFRKNSLTGTDQRHPMKPEFWELPTLEDEGKMPWPVFYLDDGSADISFGRTRYLRLGYPHTLSDGVPSEHRAAAKQLVLDYPYAILGFSQDLNAYRSRVRFGDCTTGSEPEPPFEVLLATPRPTSFADYVKDGKNYSQRNFQMRGIKQYWLKPELPNEPRGNVHTVLSPMGTGTVFEGDICFHNLHEDELGLLLWCLRLNDDCRQNIGKGKPLGYGRCKISITAVQDNPPAIYSADSLETGPDVSNPIDVDQMIACFKAYMQQALSMEDYEADESVRDFLNMHRYIRKRDDSNPPDVRYMVLNEYRNRTEILPTIQAQVDQINGVTPPEEHAPASRQANEQRNNRQQQNNRQQRNNHTGNTSAESTREMTATVVQVTKWGVKIRFKTGGQPLASTELTDLKPNEKVSVVQTGSGYKIVGRA